MTFEEAVGRIFDFKGKKFYVAKGYRRPWNTCGVLSVPIGSWDQGDYVLTGGWKGEINYHALVIDLETSLEVVIYESSLDHYIPSEWKEILPR